LEFRLVETGAVSQSDLDSKEQAAIADEQTWSKELASAVWFVSPEASVFAGNFEDKIPGPLIDFENKSLSASSVEKFLKCRHNFFTTKVLGISDMDEADSIEELRSIDFGKAVHAAFERLLKEHPELNPSYGESYSQAAKEKFQHLFQEECDLIVARGQAGWPPLFESRKQTFLNQLDDYFAFELQARTQVCDLDSRGNPALKKMNEASLLKPQFAEFEFDKTGNGLLEVEVETDGLPKQTLKFKGLIDRVDISSDRVHVGVLDFKTGSKNYIDPDTAVQDLLYEYAIRHNSNFVGVKKVSSRYLFLSKKLDDSGLIDLRSNRNLGVFLDPSEGGLQGHDYVLAMSQNQLAAESELIDRLAPLVVASYKGVFLTHDVIGSKNSFKLCATCKKLGQNTIATLSLTAHVAPPSPLEAEEEGAE
jgi:RecB family exonuclease